MIRRSRYTFWGLEKLANVDWILFLLLFVVCSIGIAMLYSAGEAECHEVVCRNFGSWYPWAVSQMVKMLVGFIAMFIASLFSPKIFVKFAYVGYFAVLIVLIMVEISGDIGMGAQRWIEIGSFRFQPSELAKISLIVALARYFASYSISEINKLFYLIIPVGMVGLYMILVLIQPDLGTALMLSMSAGIMFCLAGVSWKKFAVVGIVILMAIPVAWEYVLLPYQKQRVMVFLNPDLDVSGDGYHITQSKIAMGSGGFFGKGYLKGSQSQLNFLPEKHTDFIFTIVAEEFGMLGCLLLIMLYLLIVFRCFKISLMVRSQFSKLLVMGIGANFFLFVFINISMVMGLLPVVGVPLPFISFGGTSLMVLLCSFGLVQSAYVHKDVLISGKGVYD